MTLATVSAFGSTLVCSAIKPGSGRGYRVAISELGDKALVYGQDRRGIQQLAELTCAQPKWQPAGDQVSTTTCSQDGVLDGANYKVVLKANELTAVTQATLSKEGAVVAQMTCKRTDR